MRIRVGIQKALHVKVAKMHMNRSSNIIRKTGQANHPSAIFHGQKAAKALKRAVPPSTPVKPQHKVSVTMSVKAHKPDDNPYGFHAAHLNDAKRALASSQPYNPRKKKRHV